MTTRRNFIRILPLGLAGAGSLPLMVACGDKTPPPVPSPAPMPAAPAPAPMTPPAAAPAMPDTAATPASSGSTALVNPQEPAAIALGYVAVATTVDAGKYSKYAPGQNCSNCALYQGKAGDADGPCPLFAGRHVLATGWCSAHVNKT